MFTFCLPDFGKMISNVDGKKTIKFLDDGSEFRSYKNKVDTSIENIP